MNRRSFISTVLAAPFIKPVWKFIPHPGGTYCPVLGGWATDTRDGWVVTRQDRTISARMNRNMPNGEAWFAFKFCDGTTERTVTDKHGNIVRQLNDQELTNFLRG